MLFEQRGIFFKGRNSMYPKDSIMLCERRLEEQEHLQTVLWFVGEMAGFQRVLSESTVFSIEKLSKKGKTLFRQHEWWLYWKVNYH